MADPRTGKFFRSFEPATQDPAYRPIRWQGQVRSRVRDGLYMVKFIDAVMLVEAGSVVFNTQRMVSLDEMKDWEFFDSPEAWRDALLAYDKIAQARADKADQQAER